MARLVRVNLHDLRVLPRLVVASYRSRARFLGRSTSPTKTRQRRKKKINSGSKISSLFCTKTSARIGKAIPRVSCQPRLTTHKIAAQVLVAALALAIRSFRRPISKHLNRKEMTMAGTGFNHPSAPKQKTKQTPPKGGPSRLPGTSGKAQPAKTGMSKGRVVKAPNGHGPHHTGSVHVPGGSTSLPRT